ncbi:tripartite tricarboxylate transporter substrate binding protein [Cocleimonas sp. KMM 6892]|uniref:Bug family tripartite tricarboxylate transporter substrate binding protein n=1 Tax=unclassified Cocleimonas TaxID=2639732 RepID=UPI002DB82DD7|nr:MULTISPECIES: tripartite tricarboxylate transporter substrate binding protein [unclassified Cocleimonas]MEB8431744.1 tripartite tricarboxylate transporter substrate binding protein [Cocleimonas sp. KMM 6892]MEC4715170.1 tripartite tricarboxylate transporter substrate binding protein [Cocleimonas sp. KMM 6895]MEC4744016.1 tripartite tricarboxylate transporter substrate binding protein [Cocleimonas sp. KMM 6896]
MKYTKRIVGLMVTLAFIPLLIMQSASAEYPTKPVTLVSPYGPGGAADLAARTLSANATSYLGQGILVVNRTGAGGVTGSISVAKGKADGYTLLLARVGSQAVVPAMNRTIPYKWDEYTFLGLLELNPFVLVVNADSPYKTLDDIKKAIESGKKPSYSSAGVGTLLHVAMTMVMDQFGMDANAMKHVPYKGGGKAAAAVAGGHVDMMFQNLSGVIGNIQAGKMRAIAVTTPERVPSISDVPTVAESGYPGLETIVGWSGVWGPPKLPEEVVTKWLGVLESLKNDKAWNNMTKGLGSTPYIQNPTDTKAFVEKQYSAFKALTEKLGMTIE